MPPDAKFCPKCGSPRPFDQQPAGQQPNGTPGYPSPQPNGAGQPQGAKRSVSPALVIAIVVAVVAIIVAVALALGVFSPKNGNGSASSAPTVEESSSASSASSASSPAPSATGSSSTSSAGASASSGSASSGSSSSTSAADARKQAKDKANKEGYQVFEGTLMILTADELASMQGVDPKVAEGIEGTYAVLVFDAPIQVSGMGADGSGMRRQSATMLGVAEQTKYATKGSIDSWKAYKGQDIAIAAMAEDIWFPSDVSLPVGEPRTADAIVLG